MLIAFLAAVSPDARLSVGTRWAGEETLHFVSDAEEIDQTQRLYVTFRVTDQVGKLWVSERRSMLKGTIIDGADIPLPPKQVPDILKEWLSPDGGVLDANPLDKGLFYIDRMVEYWLPASLPNTWGVTMSKTVEHELTSGQAHFKLQGDNSGSTRTFAFTYASISDPAGIAAAGTMKFDVKSGRLLEAKVSADRAQLPEGDSHIRAHLDLTYRDAPYKDL